MKVVYEDNQVVVVIKPQNMPSQADESGDKDLLTEVKEYTKEKYNKEGQVFIGLVHRLDRPTGGLMVFARNSKSAARLSKQISEREMKKTYYAVLNGVPRKPSATITNYLKKDEKENIVKIVPQTESGAKEAVLSYKVLQTDGALALVEVQILTGRSHQIRVQMAGINCPVYGDNKYGKTAVKKTEKLALWAGRLEFIHPVSKEKMVFACPPDGKQSPWNKFYIDKYFIR